MKQAIQIAENVYWVGVHDYNCRHFHGHIFPIAEGTTYNAYLIVDEQITVIDTVEAEFMDIMLERIRSVIGDQPIHHLIVQHAEPDHSGGFTQFMKEYPDAIPYASNAGIQIMQKQYFKEYPFQKVKTGDQLVIGKETLTFVEMPLIHWPDNMMSYLNNAHILFSNDAFGQHICSQQRFDENFCLTHCLEQAKLYYANIVMPYGDRVAKKLDELAKLNWEIAMIAPAHGIIWKQYITQILDAYREYATFVAQNKAVIIYESIWKHTRDMAEALAEGLGKAGMEVKVYQASITDDALMMKELLDAKLILIGSGCYNNEMAATIAALLTKLNTCHMKGKQGLGFGSYGWYRNTVSSINQKLEEAGITLCDETILSQNYTPSTEDLDQYSAWGMELGNKIMNQSK